MIEGCVMSISGVLIPAMWLDLLPSKLMGRSPFLKNLQARWGKIAVPGTFVVDVVFFIVGMLPMIDPENTALVDVAINGPLVGIIVLCVPVALIVTVVAAKTFALAIQNPPSSLPGQLFALMFSRERYAKLGDGLKRVVMKLRVSVFLVNFIAGGAIIGCLLLLTPTWFQERPDIAESCILITAAVTWLTFCIFVFKPAPRKVKKKVGSAPLNKVGQREQALLKQLGAGRMDDLALMKETTGFLDVLGGTFVACLVAGASLGTLAMSPILLFLIFVRWWWATRHTFKRDPANMKVAIVGGGWTGCQIAASMKKLGVGSIRVFEVRDDVGGTWHPYNRYYNLNIHTPIWNASFIDFPYHSSKDVTDKRVHGADLQSYMKRFIEFSGIEDAFSFNSRVTKIDYNTKARTAKVTSLNEKTGNEQEEGPFDLVMYTGFSMCPHTPTLKGRELFTGEVFHSASIKEDIFARLVKKKKRILIVGGGKSACDTTLNFMRAGAEKEITWVFRRPYMFMRTERFFHPRGVCGMLRNYCVLIAWVTAALLPRLSWFMVTYTGHAWTYAKVGVNTVVDRCSASVCKVCAVAGAGSTK